ncbi:unnamed protein product [Penicillium glandicola]
MEPIEEALAKCKAKGRTTLITYVIAGHSTVSETPDIILSMQSGGADIIELGIPFTSPTTEGPVIKQANSKALENGVRIPHVLQMVKSARKQGLTVPVLLIGYYDSVRAYAYGEEMLLRDCKAAGVDGMIIVDLPTGELVRFCDLCKSKGLLYIPLVSSSITIDDVEMLCSTANLIVCTVSRLGVMGTHEKLYGCVADLLHRVHVFTGNLVPVTGGLSIINAQETSVDVVIGCPIVQILGNAAPGTGAQKVKEYCLQVSGCTED